MAVQGGALHADEDEGMPSFPDEVKLGNNREVEEVAAGLPLVVVEAFLLARQEWIEHNTLEVSRMPLWQVLVSVHRDEREKHGEDGMSTMLSLKVFHRQQRRKLQKSNHRLTRGQFEFRRGLWILALSVQCRREGGGWE